MNRDNSRRNEFKKGIDALEGRRRRTETTISLRKNKKDQGIAKRRAMTVTPAMPAATIGELNESTNRTASEDLKKTYTAADIPSLMAALNQPNIPDDTLLETVRGFRKVLSVEENPPVNEVLACGALPAFVQMLALDDKPKIQFEAAWALTNIASTDETKAIVDAGAVPQFTRLLSCPSAEVREQCAWCLGNIAGDSPALRDIVLASGALQPLLQNIAQPANDSLFGNCVWTLSNFCRGKPAPHLSYVAPAVPILTKILEGNNDDAKTDALWALSYISDGDDDRIDAVLNGGIASIIIDMLDGEGNMVTPALRTVGNIVSGNDSQTQAILDAGLMSKMDSVLNSSKRMVRKESCWVLSNIAAGTTAQIKTILRTKGLTQRVIEMAEEDQWEVRKEAIWVVSNIATGGSDKQIQSVIEAGAIDALCTNLNVNDSKMILVILDAIDCILKLGVKLNKDYASFVDECEGLSMIESLQEHDSDEIYQKAISIIELYFGTDDGEEDENLAPEVNGETFAFGVSKNVDEVENPANGNAQPFMSYNFAS